MPNPSSYKPSEKSKYMQDCMHILVHEEGKKKIPALAQCLTIWRKEHGGKPPSKKLAQKVAYNFLASEQYSIKWIKPDFKEEVGEYFENHYTKEWLLDKGISFDSDKELIEILGTGQNQIISKEKLQGENLTLTDNDFSKELKNKNYSKSFLEMEKDLKEKKELTIKSPILLKINNTYYGFAGNRRMNLAWKYGIPVKFWVVTLKPNIKTAAQESHPNYFQDHSNCPVCGEHSVMTCRCRIGDKFCPNKHSWHTCSVHNKVFIGDGSHTEGCLKWGSNCTCPSEIIKTVDHSYSKEAGCKAVMEDWPEKENVEYSPELPQVPLEATTALAVRALINEHPISSGWHKGFSPDFNGLKPCWAIVFKSKLSKPAIDSAQKAGLKINTRKNVGLTDIYLSDVTDPAEARSIFNSFADYYKEESKKAASILYKQINEDAVVVSKMIRHKTNKVVNAFLQGLK